MLYYFKGKREKSEIKPENMKCKIILKSNENTMCFWNRSRVPGLVMQWEGISTQCICGTPQEPFIISIFWLKWFVLAKNGYGRDFEDTTT